MRVNNGEADGNWKVIGDKWEEFILFVYRTTNDRAPLSGQQSLKTRKLREKQWNRKLRGKSEQQGD